MKKILKAFLFLVIFNFIVSVGVIGYATVSVVGTSFKGTGIGITDLLNPHLPKDKASKLQQNMNTNAANAGTQLAKKVEGVISKLLPDPNFDYSKVNPVPYPYKDQTPQIEQATKDGFQKGLDIANQITNNCEAAKQQGLDIAKSSEKANDAIKEQSLK